MSKISRKTLFDYFQTWRKGVSSCCQISPQNVKLCSRKFAYDKFVKENQTKSDITPESSNGSYVRKSPSSIIIKQNTSSQKDAQYERLFENDLAALRQSRCNGILRDYYLNHQLRQMANEEYPKKLSEMVVKLNDIMSLNVAITESEVNQEILFNTESISQYMDFKPQRNSNMNRWYIKLPQCFEICEDKEALSRQDAQGRPQKPRKLVERPMIFSKKRKPSICSNSNKEKDVIGKCKHPETWYFGSKTVPRLEQ